MAHDSHRSPRVSVPALSATLLFWSRWAGALSAQVPTVAGRDYRPLAREIFRELIEIKTTESGVGSTPAAEAVARRLRAAGFVEADIQVIGPAARKKNVVVRLRGNGRAKAPPDHWASGRRRGKERRLVARSRSVHVQRARRIFLRTRDPGHEGGRRDRRHELHPVEAGRLDPDRDLVLALTADEKKNSTTTRTASPG